MGSQGSKNNPFGKAEIYIRLNNQRSIIAKIVPRKTSVGWALQWDQTLAELDWTSDEIFARTTCSEDRALYIFEPEGRGFCINSLGQQIPLSWH